MIFNVEEIAIDPANTCKRAKVSFANVNDSTIHNSRKLGFMFLNACMEEITAIDITKEDPTLYVEYFDADKKLERCIVSKKYGKSYITMTGLDIAKDDTMCLPIIAFLTLFDKELHEYANLIFTEFEEGTVNEYTLNEFLGTLHWKFRFLDVMIENKPSKEMLKETKSTLVKLIL